MTYKLGRYAGIPYRKSSSGGAYRLANSVGYFKSLNHARARAYEYIDKDYTDTRFVEIWDGGKNRVSEDAKSGHSVGSVAVENGKIIWVPYGRKGRVCEVKPNGHLRLFRFHTR